MISKPARLSGVVRSSKIQFESKIDGVKAIHNITYIRQRRRSGVVRSSKIQFESKIDGVKAIHNLATIGTTAFLTVHNNKRLSFYDSLLFYNAPLIIMLITH